MISRAIDNSGFSKPSTTPESEVDAHTPNRNNKERNSIMLCLLARSDLNSSLHSPRTVFTRLCLPPYATGSLQSPWTAFTRFRLSPLAPDYLQALSGGGSFSWKRKQGWFPETETAESGVSCFRSFRSGNGHRTLAVSALRPVFPTKHPVKRRSYGGKSTQLRPPQLEPPAAWMPDARTQHSCIVLEAPPVRFDGMFPARKG